MARFLLEVGEVRSVDAGEAVWRANFPAICTPNSTRFHAAHWLCSLSPRSLWDGAEALPRLLGGEEEPTGGYGRTLQTTVERGEGGVGCRWSSA